VKREVNNFRLFISTNEKTRQTPLIQGANRQLKAANTGHQTQITGA
jgi:hypothetical protein